MLIESHVMRQAGTNRRPEDYLDFLAPDNIRIKGHRVGIETVLYQYLFKKLSPAEIVASYPTLSAEEVEAVVEYYRQNEAAVTSYLQNWIELSDRLWQEQQRNPPPGVVRLRKLIEERTVTK